MIDLTKHKTIEERIAYLKANKSEIIEMKKSAIKFADVSMFTNEVNNEVIKGLHTSKSSDTETTIKRTIVGNTYNWADSHGDVHLDGIFKKSIEERAGKIWHLHDHEQKITAKVGKPLSIYEKAVKWKDLGVNKAGETMALFMDSEISKNYNELVFNEYKDGNIDQHSVGMYYVKVDLALNDPDSKDEFNTWNKYIGIIGNKSIVEDRGYFFAIKEAKLIEISAVLQGSNELTPTIEAKEEVEPVQTTQITEPVQTTQTKKDAEGSANSLFYY
jgi:hypothetical protein